MSEEDSSARMDPIDDDLAALLRSERASVIAPVGAAARVMARVNASIGVGGSGSGSGSAGGSGSVGGGGRALSKSTTMLAWGSPPAIAAIIAVFGLGIAVGAFGLRVTEKVSDNEAPRVVYVDRVVPNASSSSPVIAFSAVPVAPPTSSASSATSMNAVAPVSSSHQLAEERAILDVARSALGANDGAAALAATDKHLKKFPAGMLGEEREALAIQALALLSRGDEARARGARFQSRYPRSVLLPTISATLESIP